MVPILRNIHPKKIWTCFANWGGQVLDLMKDVQKQSHEDGVIFTEN